jgi:hypothetical protein
MKKILGEKEISGYKKIVLISFLLIIAMAVILFLVVYNFSNNESYINQEIKKAKYCEEDHDCVDAGGKCPFGCSVYVNKNEVERIGQLIDSFDLKCIYDCINCPTAVCENKKCMAECEDGKLY